MLNTFDPQTIIGSQTLMEIFGHWPDFHDAEIISVHLLRDRVQLRVTLTVFERRGNETDDRGYYVRQNEGLLALRFDDTEDLIIENFNHQNVLMSLSFRKVSDRIHVVFEPAFGCYASFSCSAVTIEEFTLLGR